LWLKISILWKIANLPGISKEPNRYQQRQSKRQFKNVADLKKKARCEKHPGLKKARCEKHPGLKKKSL
jgi:hypothetical protein